MGEEFPRQTFLKVMKAQESVRKTLKEWAGEEKTVDDDEEIDFRREMSKATLGLNQHIRFKKVHKAWSNINLSTLITMLLDANKPKIKVGSAHDAEEQKKVYSIAVFWNKLLERLNEAVFDDALNLALKVSPEREEKTGKTHSGPRD